MCLVYLASQVWFGFVFCIFVPFFGDGFKRIFKYSAEGPSSALHHKKAAMCLMEKIRGLDKLHSGRRHSAAG